MNGLSFVHAQLSEQVLARVFAATGARAVTRVERVQSLWSGYGQIMRLWLSGGDHATVVVKLVQPMAAGLGMSAEQLRSHARKLQSYAVEQSFYERYAARCGDDCRVAHTLACARIDESTHQWLFVLEDLDASGFSVRPQQLPASAMRACLGWLAHFHAQFMGEPPLELWPVGSYWHLDTRPDELARASDLQLRAAASQLDARLRAATYRTLLHGDAKLENFCFNADLRRVAAVDFQYTGAGCGVQDVAYFLSSCLSDEACEAEASTLLDYYFTVLSQATASQHPGIDREALEAEWRDLYPIAWADFSRFMSGWARGYDARSGYAGRMTKLALDTIVYKTNC